MKQLKKKTTKPSASVGANKGSFKERLGGFWSRTYNLLFHEDIYYRIGGYLIFGLLLFLVTWAFFAFVIKKPNLLMDSFLVEKFSKTEIVQSVGPWGADTFGETWKIFGKEYKVNEIFATWGNVAILTFKFFLNHLVFVLLFIFGLNLFKISRWNLGTIYFIFYTILWGAVVGTTSQSYPVGDNLVFGPLILFARFGLWNWFSYLLLVVSSAHFSWLAAPKWTEWVWEKQRPFWPIKFTPDQKELFIYGVLFLLASCFAEARVFVHYNLIF